ncbi:flagellar hook-basal body protein FliE [Clostridioides difficile]|uniref:hypothetical protein n=1 Tax=Clostridioides difficile TaxID=1496 RepID=UPI0010285CE2|nr:hypothetical protein [Clostridioides difficile]VFC77253.1 flagellar hook-basal body protein FliE [Clostridioides difficile]
MPITQINNLIQGAKLDNLIGEAKPLTLNNKEEKKNFEDVIIDTVDKVVSIPLFIGMKDEEVSYIIKIINEY